MDWMECNSRRIVKDVNPDTNLIDSLIESSRNKMVSESKLAMSKVTAASKVSLAYDSLRELLEALALKKGFKVYNHECYAAFLKEVVKNSSRGDDFNRIRKVRNAINYYGKRMTPEEASALISKVSDMRSFVSESLEE